LASSLAFTIAPDTEIIAEKSYYSEGEYYTYAGDGAITDETFK